MSRDDEVRQNRIYYIPENFIDEGRINAGMISVRTRYLVEAVIYGLIFVFLSFFIPVKNFNNRLTVSIFVAGPAFALGLAGINGEPVSTSISHIKYWYTHRQVMLYDNTPLVLTESPVDRMMNDANKTSPFLLRLEERKKKRVEARDNQEFILGKTFEFAADRDYTREYITLEDLIQREIDRRKQSEQDELSSLEEVVMEDVPVTDIFPEDVPAEDAPVVIVGDDPDDDDALAGIDFMSSTPTIVLNSADSDDDLLFDGGKGTV